MEWQPIATAPMDTSDFYALADYGHGNYTYGIGYRFTNGRVIARDSAGDDFAPTHWMLTPPAPSTIEAAK